MSFALSLALRRRPALATLTIAAAFLLCTTGFAQSAPPLPAPLSLADALRLAQDRSRQLPAQDAAVAAARDMAVAAAQKPDPVLKAGINNLPVNGPDRFSLTRDFMTMRSLGVAQELTRGDKLQARTARFEREAQAAEAGRALALANLQRDTALAWLDRYHQERLRALMVQQRDEAALQIEASEAAYRGGRGSQSDVFAARLGVAQIDERLLQIERQVAMATTLLARWIGSAAARPLGQAPATDAVPLRPTDLEGEILHHPQVTLLAKREQVARAEVQVALSNQKSDWNVELMFSQRGPAFSNMVSVNVSIPLQWDPKNRQDRELGAKLALVEQVRAERDEATRAHLAEATVMLQEWQGNRERLSRYEKALIPLANERTRAVLTAYRANTGTLAAVLEARRAEIDTRMERIRLDMDTARLWAQLHYLIPAGHEPAARDRTPTTPATATEQ
jgi:outer membrane protein TolC